MYISVFYLPGAAPSQQTSETETEENHSDPAAVFYFFLPQVTFSSVERSNMIFPFSWFPFSICRILNEVVVDLHEKSGEKAGRTKLLFM